MKRDKESKYRIKIIQEFHFNKEAQGKIDWNIKSYDLTYKEYYEFCCSHFYPPALATLKLLSERLHRSFSIIANNLDFTFPKGRY